MSYGTKVLRGRLKTDSDGAEVMSERNLFLRLAS